MEKQIDKIISQANPATVGMLICDHRRFNKEWLNENQRAAYDVICLHNAIVPMSRLKNTEIAIATGLGVRSIDSAISGDATPMTAIIISGFIILFRQLGLQGAMDFIDKHKTRIFEHLLLGVIRDKMTKRGPLFNRRNFLCGFWQVLIPENELPEALKLHNYNPEIVQSKEN